MSIYYIDRKTGEKKQEKVAGFKLLEWIYQTRSGSIALESLLKRKFLSSLYGRMQDARFSARKIKSFVENLDIDISEAKHEDLTSYKTFNDFFIRELKKESRPIDADPAVLISPADGRVLAWQTVDTTSLLQVKGFHYSLTDLLQDQALASRFEQGSCMIIRLCPSDYHRFHFPDSGVPSPPFKIKGNYYSVNPLALKKIPRLYCENKREFTLFRSDNFGEMVIMEVGATFVGSIIQTYTPEEHIEKAGEKGYFKFGGSTVIIFLQKDTVRLDEDILSNTANGMETMVHMGERIGAKI